jgi:hypothetical protein
MARDATSAGDRIAAENYLQHAEHYYRILNANSGEQHGPNGRSRGNGRSETNGFDRNNEEARDDEAQDDGGDEAGPPSRRRSARSASSQGPEQDIGQSMGENSVGADIDGADEPTEGIA